MADIFEIVGRISLDGIDKAEKELNNFTENGEKSSAKLSKLGSIAKGVGKGVLAVGSAVTAGSVTLIKGVQSSYGELQQNLGGSEAVFGQYAKNVQKIGEEAYRNMGMSQSQFLATANKMGSLLQGSGISQQESLDMTTKAMQRASDVASVMGIDMTTAMESITGACKGNFTMMDNLGVAMNATTLEAYALEKGMSNFSWKTATQAEKNTLAMQMFLERTEQYAGNFARESTETITGAMGNLSSAWQDFMAGLGNPEADMARLTNNLAQSFAGMVKNITPIIENITNALPTVMETLLKAISDLLPSLIDTFTNVITQVINSIVAMLPTIIPLLVDCLKTVIEALVQNLPQIIDAVILLITEVMNALSEMLPTLIPLIIKAVIDIANSLIENLPILLNVVLQTIIGVAQALIDNIPILINALPQIIEGIVSFLVEAMPMLIQASIQLFMALVEAIPEIVVALSEALPQIIMTILSGLGELALQIGVWVAQLFVDIGEWFANIGTIISQKMPEVINGIISFVKTLPSKMGYWLGYAIGTVANWVVNLKNKALDAGKSFLDNIMNFFNDLPSNIATLLNNTISNVSTFISNLANKATEGASNFATNMLDGIKDLPNDFISIGTDIVNGMWNGILDAGKWLNDNIGDFADGVVNGFKDAFGIHSPSRIMAGVGNFLTQGLGVGIEEDDTAEQSIKEKVDSILNIANGSMGNLRVGTSVDDLIAENPMNKYQLDFNAQFGALSDGFDRLVSLVGNYLPNIAGEMGRPIMIDGNSLAIGISRQVDAQLGRMSVSKGRGNV